MIVEYAILTLAVLFLVKRFQPTPMTVIALTVGIGLSYAHFVYNTDVISRQDTREQMFKILDNYQDNPNYERVRNAMKNFYKQRDLVDSNQTTFNQVHDNLVEMKNVVQNEFHSLLYGNKSDLEQQLQHVDDMRLVTKALNEVVNDSQSSINNRNAVQEITTRTKFHYRNHPGGNDPSFDQHFTFFQKI